jgi:K+-sensing histidine kinase KdpD
VVQALPERTGTFAPAPTELIPAKVIAAVGAACACMLVAAGIVCFLGQLLGVSWLINPRIADAGPSPVAVIYFVFIGCFLLRLRAPSSKPVESLIAGACLAMIAVIAVIINHGDNFLSPPATLSLACLAGAFLCLGAPNKAIQGLSHAFVVFIIGLSVLRIIKYTYGLTLLEFVGDFHFETAIMAIIAGVGLVCMRPHQGLLRMLVSPTVSGQMVRALLPMVILIPFLGLITGPFATHPLDLVILLVLILCGLPLTVLILAYKLEPVELQRKTFSETLENLYDLSREMLAVHDSDELINIAVRQLKKMLDCSVVILHPQDRVEELAVTTPSRSWILNTSELAAAQQALTSKQLTTVKRDDSNSLDAAFVPLNLSQGVAAVVGIRRVPPRQAIAPRELNLLQGVADVLAVALDRIRFRIISEGARLEMERESQRASLLSSVSHDLRTPLSAISGAASSLLASSDKMSTSSAQELFQSIYDESDRMNRLVQNLLDMTKLQSGVTIKKDWYSLEEIVGTALSRLQPTLKEHRIVTDLPFDLPLVSVDSLLIEQLFINLIDNACKYSDPASEISISARAAGATCNVEVANTGSHLSDEESTQLFERFFSGSKNGLVRNGAGLGLTICKAIAQVHDGGISAANKDGDGVVFTITLPVGEGSPIVNIGDSEGDGAETL